MSFPNNNNDEYFHEIRPHQILNFNTENYHQLENYYNSKKKNNMPIPENYYENQNQNQNQNKNYSSSYYNNVKPFNNYQDKQKNIGFEELPDINKLNITKYSYNLSKSEQEKKLVEHKKKLQEKQENNHFKFKPYFQQYDNTNGFLASNDHLNFHKNINKNSNNLLLINNYFTENNNKNKSILNSTSNDVDYFSKMKTYEDELNKDTKNNSNQNNFF